MKGRLSLRSRLIGLIAIVLVAVAALGGLLNYLNAKQKVALEAEAALAGAGNTVARVLGEMSNPTREDLAKLLPVFDGTRHVRLELIDRTGTVLAASRLLDPANDVPDWFVRAIGGPDSALDYAAPISASPVDRIRLKADPRSEIDEVWGDLMVDLIVLGGFAVTSFVLTAVVIGRALSPLGPVSRAFARIGDGETDVRLPEEGPPEIRALCRALNEMSARLSEVSRRNTQLSGQLSRLQDEERAELARDLHDEVGPYLFALDVDAAAIAKLAAANGGSKAGEIADRAAAVREAAAHARTHVRMILGQLRPGLVGNLGLAQAVRDIATFHGERHPQIAFSVDVPGRSLGPDLDGVLLSVIREAVNNAVRHGRPRTVDITVAEMNGEVAFSVLDDGVGLGDSTPGMGYGLINMRERVRGAGGEIFVASRRTGGTAVSGLVPARPPGGGRIARSAMREELTA